MLKIRRRGTYPVCQTDGTRVSLCNTLNNFSLKEENMANPDQIRAPSGGRGVRGGHLGRRRQHRFRDPLHGPREGSLRQRPLQVLSSQRALFTVLGTKNTYLVFLDVAMIRKSQNQCPKQTTTLRYYHRPTSSSASTSNNGNNANGSCSPPVAVTPVCEIGNSANTLV